MINEKFVSFEFVPLTTQVTRIRNKIKKKKKKRENEPCVRIEVSGVIFIFSSSNNSLSLCPDTLHRKGDFSYLAPEMLLTPTKGVDSSS